MKLEDVYKVINEIIDRAENTITSQDILADQVRKYWKETGYSHDVVCYFKQKYSRDEKWDICYTIAECESSSDFNKIIFFDDFCEGQEDIKDIHIVDLEKVLDYYGEVQIWKH